MSKVLKDYENHRIQNLIIPVFFNGTYRWSAWCYVRVNETQKMFNDEKPSYYLF